MTKTLEVVAKKKRLGDVKAVSELIDVSREHVRRLDDRGAMPKSIRLGRSIRWDMARIESWIADGCPDLSKQRPRR